MPRILLFSIVMIAAGAVAAAVVPLAVRLGWRWRAIDHPDQRKHHDGPVPRTGGLAIAAGIVAGLLTASALGLVAPTEAIGPWTGAMITAATALIFGVGLLDDVRGCGVGAKLAAQLVAAVMVVAGGVSVTFVLPPIGGPIDFGAVTGSIVAVVWLMGITNAINFMDGLDGLAGGLAAIVAISLGAFALIQGVPLMFAVAAALCGACLGFLPFNWRPARIFLGDSGSMTTGFVLGWLSLIASLKSSTIIAIFVPLLALGVPAIDAVLVILARFAENVHGRGIRQRVSRMFQADRLHLHHRALSIIGLGRHRFVVLLLYAVVACSCVFALGAAARSNPTLAAATLAVEIAVVIVIRFTRFRARER